MRGHDALGPPEYLLRRRNMKNRDEVSQNGVLKEMYKLTQVTYNRRSIATARFTWKVM